MATKWEASSQEILIQLAELKERLSAFRDEVNRANLFDLLRKVAVIEERLAELKRLKEETDRKYWQFYMLFIGGIITLAIQVLILFFKK